MDVGTTSLTSEGILGIISRKVGEYLTEITMYNGNVFNVPNPVDAVINAKADADGTNKIVNMEIFGMSTI